MPINPYYGDDYVVINSGATFAVGADPVLVGGGYTTYIQYYKLGYGPTGAFTPVDASNPFPVTVATGLTAIISGFTGPIQVEGVVGGQAVTVSGTVTVQGISSAPVYVQTSPSCYVEVTGGRYLNKLNDNVSVFGPNGSTWIYSSLVNSSGTELGNSANPVYVQISGATINATINPTVGVTNTSSTPLFICGTSGATAVNVTVGNTVGINDTAILASMAGICGELTSLNAQILSIAGSVPSSFTTNRVSVTTSAGLMDSGTGFTCTNGINLKAAATNTNLIFFGNTSAISSTNAYGLDPGEEIFLKIDNTKLVYLIAGSGTQSLFYSAS
jgi:hypothetical protein